MSEDHGADAQDARKRARAELLAAVEEFDTAAKIANVRLVNAIEDMILAIMGEADAGK